MENENYILRENLISALTIAIEKQVEDEKKLGFDRDSCLVGGWRENLKVLKNNKILKIK